MLVNHMSLNVQAQAFLPIVRDWLQNRSDSNFESFITPLYNGRERGYVLSITHMPPNRDKVPALCIFFAECRNSDNFFLWTWLDTRHGAGMVGGRLPELPNDTSYHARKEVPYLRLDLALDHFEHIVTEHCDRYKASR